MNILSFRVYSEFLEFINVGSIIIKKIIIINYVLYFIVEYMRYYIVWLCINIII